MAHRLRVESVSSSSRLSGALSPGQADDYGEYDGEILVVDDEDEAASLVARHHNVSWADAEPEPVSEETVMRANVDNDGATYECGVNGCSREVDSPDDTCWQHDED